jgi:selenocysteine lyase/cysteine desulfurase
MPTGGLVAITGASNVTGYLNAIHRLAEKTHQPGKSWRTAPNWLTAR